MKHSPLCSRQDGKEIMFTAKDGDTKLRFVIGRDMLDDICGQTANEPARKKWVNANLTQILEIRPKSAAQVAPFDRISVKEIA